MKWPTISYIVCLDLFFVLYLPPLAHAVDGENYGAFVEQMTTTPRDILFTFLVPSNAELICVDAQEMVNKSVRADISGKIITALTSSGEQSPITACFISEGSGLSSRIFMNSMLNQSFILMPPTIYGIPNINGQTGDLGYIGKGFPGADVILEIDGDTNEKVILKTLANTTGEWQIIPPKLSPGRHQAKAQLQYQGVDSGWSQTISIQVLETADQVIQDIGMGTRRTLENAAEALPTPVRDAVKQIDDKSSFIAKVVFPTILTLTTIAQSGLLLQNLLYLFFQALVAIGQATGLIKKKQPMGIIYDAVSKRPLGRTIVRLYEASTQKLIETDVTSAAGIFSFLPPEGFYYLRVSKPGYIFPSQLIVGKRDGRFAPIYAGGEFRVSAGQEVVNLAVPLDPEAYQETWQMTLAKQFQRWYEPLNQWLLWLGMFLAFLAYTRQPTRLNFVILWLYALGILYFWWQKTAKKREYGVVVNYRGKPLANVELILTDVEYNRLVSRRVTDEKGRYQFIAPPGRYQIRIVSTGWEIVEHARRAYNNEELKIEGERGSTKHIIPKIVVRAVTQAVVS